jgi:hypothetical protein
MSSQISNRPFLANYTAILCGGLRSHVLHATRRHVYTRHHSSANISFNFLSHVLRTRVCLQCRITRREENFLQDMPQTGKIVGLPESQFSPA